VSGCAWWRLSSSAPLGYVEAAVVTYLRRIIGFQSGYQEGARKVYLDLGDIAFVQPNRSVLVDPVLTQVEIAQEAATLVILVAIGVVAADTLRRRLAAFFVAFTVWDLTYYLFLRMLDGWPTGLLDRDVFFLIPVTWVGPVATAVVASSVVLVVSSRAYLAGGRGWRDPEPPRGGERVRRADRDAIESSGRFKTSGA
jgi:hypothetical protein